MISRKKKNMDIPDKCAKGAYSLVCIWSIFLMAVLFLDAIEAIKFHLSDNVIITLIAGVTLNIIAVLIVVMKYLFPRAIENINE